MIHKNKDGFVFNGLTLNNKLTLITFYSSKILYIYAGVSN